MLTGICNAENVGGETSSNPNNCVDYTKEMGLCGKRMLLALENTPPLHSDDYFELQHIMDVIQAHIDIAGSQRIFSAQIEVTQSYVSNILNRIREPSKKVLDAIGYEAVTVYRKTVV
jgi:hypothetical protein